MRRSLYFASAVVLFSFIWTHSLVAKSPPSSCENRVNNTQKKLAECVTLDGVRAHQAVFQEIADANGGTRTALTPGYDDSVDYVAGLLTDAGYDVTVQEFLVPFFQELQPAILEQIAPNPTSYPYFSGSGFATMDYSGSGDVTSTAEGVDIIDPTGQPANTSTSGCEASDFAGFTPGNIAVIQRGSCAFVQKAFNAVAAGAAGVIIFNEGQPGRTAAFLGTLGGPGVTVPVVGAAYNVGMELAAGGVTVRMFTDTISEFRTSSNVIAETPGGRADNVIMVGAHLDSVPQSPGINDGGSGSAAILEIALQMAKVKPKNKVRFAWWGANENGLLGSTSYVNGLSAEEIDDIALYLSFDMIGSPNYVFFIYDGDNSDGVGADAGPEGSAQIERLFEEYFTEWGMPFKGTDLSGQSDYGPFINAGIPAGGLFTGAAEIKTDEEAAIWGGTAWEQYDPCYHLPCDTFDNVSLTALDFNAGAAAYAILQYAMNTEEVNGVSGKGNFQLTPGKSEKAHE